MRERAGEGRGGTYCTVGQVDNPYSNYPKYPLHSSFAQANLFAICSLNAASRVFVIDL